MTSTEKEGYFLERTSNHISRVVENAKVIFEYDSVRFKDLVEQAYKHDMSKFSKEEVGPYIKITHYYMCKAKGLKAEELSKEEHDEVLDAIFHHLKSNEHHPEYYDNNATRERSNTIIDAKSMPDLFIAEMLCDWMAMSQEFNNSIHKFSESVVNKKFIFTDKQVNLINELIGVLDNGSKTVSTQRKY